MKRLWPVFLLLVFSLTGCTTLYRRDLQLQGLKNEISALKVQLQDKDTEIENLKIHLQTLVETSIIAKEEQLLLSPATRTKAIPEVKSRPNASQIQTALRNAGYNPGLIDGKIGKQTRQAIQAFQKDHGLAVDGKVGKQTWNLLKDYFYKKIK